MLSELKPRKVAPGDAVGETPFKGIYYGVGCSGAQEPIDQLAGFLLAKRACEFYGEGNFVPFIAGKYDILNCESKLDLEWMSQKFAEAEQAKREEYRFLMKYLSLSGEVLVADDLWKDPAYWAGMETLLTEFQGIISAPDEEKYSLNFNELRLDFLGPVSGSLLERIGNTKANRLYILAEVAEAKYLGGRYSIDAKIGPQDEQMYDTFIGQFSNIIQYTQPVDLETRPQRVKMVCPYRAGQYQPRLYLTDSQEDIEEKVRRAVRRCAGDPPAYKDPKSGRTVLNPVVQSAVFAVETARALGEVPVWICGEMVSSGSEVVELARKGVGEWAAAVSRLVWEYVVKPFSEAFRK